MQSWFLPAAVAFLCWGVWALLPKLTVRYLDPTSAIVYEALGGLLVALVALALLAFRPAADPRGVGLALATGVLGVAGALAYLVAVARGPVTPVATVTALYPVLTVALAALLLQEPVTLRQGVGIVLGLVAIVLITA
jgi:transporter family protein